MRKRAATLECEKERNAEGLVGRELRKIIFQREEKGENGSRRGGG